MGQLTNKTALVTGGRQGIGGAIVDMFLAEDARVFTCGRGVRPDDLDEAIGWMKTDVSNNAEVLALKEAIEREFGTLTILVNNAGVQIEKTVIETTDDDWDILMGANAKGVFNACRAFIDTKAARRGLFASHVATWRRQ